MSTTDTAGAAPGRLTKIGAPIVGAIVAIAAWWGAVEIFDVQTFFLPSPPVIVESFLAQPVYLFQEAWYTLYETLVGYVIAVVIALILAVVLAAVPIVERATTPLLVTLNSVPKVAIAPLLVIWLGFGDRPAIFLAALICFFPLVVAAMAGFSSTPADISELARSMKASWLQTYLKFRVPYALPQIFVGLKVAMSMAPIGAVVAEVYNPSHGLGTVVALASGNADTPLAFAAIVLLAFMSVGLYYIVVVIERLALPWARAITG